jgi:chromosome segregation ATPase
MSDDFGRRHPFRLSRDLMTLRKEKQALQQALSAESARTQEAEVRLAALRDERDRQIRTNEARIAELAGILERQEAELASARQQSDSQAASLAARFDELAKLTGLLERQKAELAALRAGTRREDQARMAAELAKLQAYTRDLEKAHLRLLDSRSWRVMEPLRRMMRAVKGGRQPKPFAPRLIPGGKPRAPR